MSINEDIKTKRIIFGAKAALKRFKKGEVEKIYVAADCPENILEILGECKDVVKAEETAENFKEMCKKPFSITTIAVLKGAEEKKEKGGEEVKKAKKERKKKEKTEKAEEVEEKKKIKSKGKKE